MSSFTRKTRVALIKIQGGDYDGLELKLSLSISMGDFIEFLKNRFGPESSLESQADAMSWFGEKVLIGWNMTEEDGTPVEANAEGFLSLEPAMVFTIISRWRESVTEIDVPLVSGSTDGDTSPVASTTTGAE